MGIHSSYRSFVDYIPVKPMLDLQECVRNADLQSISDFLRFIWSYIFMYRSVRFGASPFCEVQTKPNMDVC
jgi:hypothetical protein